jgi:hypothetical protein
MYQYVVVSKCLPVEVIYADSINTGVAEAGKTSKCKFEECPSGTHSHQQMITGRRHEASFLVHPASNMHKC